MWFFLGGDWLAQRETPHLLTALHFVSLIIHVIIT